MVSLTSNNHRATSVSYMRKRFVCKIFIVFFFSVEYYLCLGCVFPSLPVIRSPTFFVSLVCRVCAVVSQCLSFLFYFDSLSPRLFCFPSYSLITQLPSCSVILFVCLSVFAVYYMHWISSATWICRSHPENIHKIIPWQVIKAVWVFNKALGSYLW